MAPKKKKDVVSDIDFFPLGLATNKSFCNRYNEQKHLKANIRTACATLVTSPRRYGKTSLVLYVIQQLKLPYSHIDLFAETDELTIQNAILSGIGDALYMVESGTKKALKFVTDFFAGLNISFNFENIKAKVEISKSRKSPPKIILTALEKLETTLAKKGKKVILFFDEFQKLAQVTESHAIEGALRHVAQKSKNICFVFSGSNRHLLSKMFDDRTRPFYNLCDRIILDRISANHCKTFIQEKARFQWNDEINEDALEAILDLSKRHPYFLNVLCHRLWQKAKKPVESDVLSTWNSYVWERKPDISAELDLLSENQAKMLIAIAKHGAYHSPTSGEFIARTRFSLSSASLAIKSLLKLDYIYALKDGKYRVTDPAMEYLFTL